MNRQSRIFWPPPGKDRPATSQRSCDHPGCREAGEFRAPKSRQTLNEYYWFCLPHVRAYNQAWDFYAGLQPEEIEAMVRQDITWQRPTWPLGRRVGGKFRFDAERVKDPFGVFDEDDFQKPSGQAAPNGPEVAAMEVMQLKAPLTIDGLKSRYKELCKQHHPDANGGDLAAEERFKVIGQAYKVLMETLNS